MEAYYARGWSLKMTGDYAGARTCFERVVTISEKTLGAEHPDTQGSRQSLAAIEKKIGDLAA